MVPLGRKFPPFAGSADCVLRPAQEHGSLGNIERPRAVLEHLWNITVVHRWGPLVRFDLNGSLAGRMAPLGW